jgi:hypothetical protein
MPFVRGRYHINPVLGEALEAAREAEAALLALEEAARGNRDQRNDSENEENDAAEPERGSGPVHRVEIEAAEVVPPHTGRAQRGFVARIHRRTATKDAAASNRAYFADGGQEDASTNGGSSCAARPEKHMCLQTMATW